MATFEVTFTASQTVTVVADSYDDAEKKAWDLISSDEWEDEQVDEVEKVSDDIVRKINTCSTCKNCTGIDEYYNKATCSVDGVPNAHCPGGSCCLYQTID